MRFPAIDCQLDGAPDHQLGQLLVIRLGGAALAHHTAAADHCDPVGNLQDLMQLVAYEDDRPAVIGQVAKEHEDLLGLGRGEHSGGLIKDEDLRVAIEGLQDLDSLLLADGQRLHLGVRVELEPKSAGQLADPPAGLAPVEEDGVRHGFLAEHDVLGDRQNGDQHEVLVHHLDSAGDGVGRSGDPDGLAVDENLTLIRDRETVEDVHQGGLAGAVLPEKGVDLALPQVEVDVVVGDDTGVALGDAPHLKLRGGGRWFRGGRRCFRSHPGELYSPP